MNKTDALKYIRQVQEGNEILKLETNLANILKDFAFLFSIFLTIYIGEHIKD